ncbi:23_t:CDS:1, partial [Paraglomus occultum]
MFGDNLSKELVLRNYILVKKDNNGDKDNSPSPNPAAPAPQLITDSNKKNDNSVNPGHSPKPNPEKDSLPEEKNGKEDNAVKSTENSPIKTDNQILISQCLRDIKQVTLTADGDLIIEFNNSENSHSISQVVTSGQINNNQELQKIKNYCQRNGKNSLSQQELNSILTANSTATESPKEGNNTLLVGGIICAALIVGVVTGLLLKKKK